MWIDSIALVVCGAANDLNPDLKITPKTNEPQIIQDARSKKLMVLHLSLKGIASSNPARGVSLCCAVPCR